jgi:hypothetical protein
MHSQFSAGTKPIKPLFSSDTRGPQRHFDLLRLSRSHSRRGQLIEEIGNRSWKLQIALGRETRKATGICNVPAHAGKPTGLNLPNEPKNLFVFNRTSSYWLRFATPACRKRRGWFRTAGRMVMETRCHSRTTSGGPMEWRAISPCN